VAPKKASRPKKKVNRSDPIPAGFELLHILRGVGNTIRDVAWSPDGRTLAAISAGKGFLWDVNAGEAPKSLTMSDPSTPTPLRARVAGEREASHPLEVGLIGSGGVHALSWSPDGRTLALALNDGAIVLQDADSGERLRNLERYSGGYVPCLSWSPDGSTLASGSNEGTICLWNTADGKLRQRLESHGGHVIDVAWSPDGALLAWGEFGGNLCVWDAMSGQLAWKQQSPAASNFAFTPDGLTLVFGTVDNRIVLSEAATGRPIKIMEGHTHIVAGVDISSDGRWIASKSVDGTVRVWNTATGSPVAVLNEPATKARGGGFVVLGALQFHPIQPILATLGEDNTAIRIWSLRYDRFSIRLAQDSVRYTTAKIVLVGDSGVGKTGLGWRLAHNEFKEHSSTHGQQFWTITRLGTTRGDGTQCEAVLWDLAGQPDYRLVHSLFLDDVDLALVLFDPTNRQEPLAGADFWLNQLRHPDRAPCNCILVGARTDRGIASLTEAELAAYCERHGISGGYVATSAKEGEGLPALIEAVAAQIAWDRMPATVTTTTFKRIKEYVLSLKEDETRAGVLVTPAALRERLEALDKDWEFSDEEMMTAVRHLETHGYVTILRGSQGSVSVLLTPDLLANLASSFVLEARRNPRGLGCLEENRLLNREYKFPELIDLPEDEQEILLDAATVLFLKHNLCFRETFGQQTLLVFPSLINEKRPGNEEISTVEDVTYSVRGAVENVYASLVVLLGYTNTFVRTNQWQSQAQYELGDGEICGFQQTGARKGEIQLVLYYGMDTPDHARLLFRGLFERFLSRRNLDIARYQAVVCSNTKCGECSGPQLRDTALPVMRRRGAAQAAPL
jgi:small GTP-binding protein